MVYVEHVRPDVTIIDRFLISYENLITFIEDSRAGRPVYVFGAPLVLPTPAEFVPV